MSELSHVLRHLLPVDDPNALVDATTGDDAAVYRLSNDRALVVSVDFFTPIVDDARDFGRIGAANALSDLYAMGARPLFALNLVAFPRDLLGDGILEDILGGGGEVCQEAGIAVLGGHSIDDKEPKSGMLAIGEVHPGRVVTNTGARAGDRLVLTKPLGSGVITTAHKAGAAPEDVVRSAVEVMVTLNRKAADAMLAVGIRAGTDVTGYGLLGHLSQLLMGSGVAATLDSAAVPLMDGAEALAAAGHVSGGTERNLKDIAEDVSFDPSVSEVCRILLADAQTSGGLLLAVPSARVHELTAEFADGTSAAPVIGGVIEGPAGEIQVV